MATKTKESSLIKIVYFDEESASDLLDMNAGGKETTTTEDAKQRQNQFEADAAAKAGARFNWLPFFGGSAEAGAAASTSALGRNILNKTLSNTILTDYLDKHADFKGVEKLEGLTLTAREGSAAHTKMFTPYLAMLNKAELPVNLAELDSALEAAKGYYELVGKGTDGTRRILRFNIQAFRNNYGLVDLGRMNLIFHGVRVGEALESSLKMDAEMSPGSETKAPISPREAALNEDPKQSRESGALHVYDVLLAGVQYVA